MAWSDPAGRDLAAFRARVASHSDLWAALRYDFFVQPPAGVKDQLLLGAGHEVRLDPPSPGARVHCTTDGTAPTFASPSCDRPVTIRETTTLRAITVLPNGRSSEVAQGIYRVTAPNAAVEVGAIGAWSRDAAPDGHGLHCGRGAALPLVLERFSGSVAIPADVPEDGFGLEFEGFVRAPAAGVFTFYLASDDGSRLFVDEEAIVDHDGTHGPTEKQGLVALAEGWHRLRLVFFEAKYGQSLTLEWEGPGFGRQAIPESALGSLPR